MSNEQDTDLAWRIMEAAGGTRIRVEEYAPGYYLVASREHGAGVTSPKEDAFDTVQEVALHLVSQQAVARAREQEKAAEVEAAHVETFAPDPIAPTTAGTGGNTDAGQWEMGDGFAAADVPLGDAGQGAASDAAVDGGGVGDEPGESGLVRSAVEGEDFVAPEEEPTDAEFEEPVSADDLAGIEDALRGEPLLTGVENEEYEPVYAGPIDPHPGGVVYFGDDIKVIQLAKTGRLMEIAQALKDVLQEGWTVDQYAEAQGYVLHNTNDAGAFIGDPAQYAYFISLSDRRNAMARVDAYMSERQRELSTLDREGIIAFDPEYGWPE